MVIISRILAPAVISALFFPKFSNAFLPVHTPATPTFSQSKVINSLSSFPQSALLDPYILDQVSHTLTTTSITTSTVSPPFTTENIKTAFSVATFLPQPFWLLLILFPNASITKTIMGKYGIQTITLFCLVHFFIVFSSILQPDGTAPLVEFNDVFDPSGDPQKAMMGMMKYPNFVSEEWSHVLTWDLFVGRWIWMDGLKKRGDDGKGVFTGVSVLFCNLIGPPGFLIHFVTSLVSGKGVPGNYEDYDELGEV